MKKKKKLNVVAILA